MTPRIVRYITAAITFTALLLATTAGPAASTEVAEVKTWSGSITERCQVAAHGSRIVFRVGNRTSTEQVIYRMTFTNTTTGRFRFRNVIMQPGQRRNVWRPHLHNDRQNPPHHGEYTIHVYHFGELVQVAIADYDGGCPNGT